LGSGLRVREKFALELTRLQLEALWGMVRQANGDGDYEEWLRGQKGAGPEIRACQQVMEKIALTMRQI
jgi:hypothetical protein